MEGVLQREESGEDWTLLPSLFAPISSSHLSRRLGISFCGLGIFPVVASRSGGHYQYTQVSPPHTLPGHWKRWSSSGRLQPRTTVTALMLCIPFLWVTPVRLLAIGARTEVRFCSTALLTLDLDLMSLLSSQVSS